MRSFLTRLSSRKFLIALAVQIASVVALFQPHQEQMLHDAAVRIAALITLLLAALGYGTVEASLDASAAKHASDPTPPKDF